MKFEMQDGFRVEVGPTGRVILSRHRKEDGEVLWCKALDRQTWFDLVGEVYEEMVKKGFAI